MSEIIVKATSHVSEKDLADARLGTRFARLDLASRLALFAVESLEIGFTRFEPERVAICLAASTGSLTTDVDYWTGRDPDAGPSPTLFAYTLPSAAVGEIAIRHKLTGPNLCFVGDENCALAESRDLLERGEADACICLYAKVVSEKASEIFGIPAVAETRATFIELA